MEKEKALLLYIGKDGIAREYKEPFATIECPREEDYNYIKAAVEFYGKHKWYKVEERLPDDDGFVLVIVNGKHRNVEFDNAIMMAALDGDQWYVEGWPDWENPNVTHWMMLPDPPEGVEKE